MVLGDDGRHKVDKDKNKDKNKDKSKDKNKDKDQNKNDGKDDNPFVIEIGPTCNEMGLKSLLGFASDASLIRHKVKKGSNVYIIILYIVYNQIILDLEFE